MSTLLHKWRWNLFRHILKLPKLSPARRVMHLYFQLKEKHAHVKRGNTRTSLLGLLQQDLKRVESTHHLSLNSLQDLHRLELRLAETNCKDDFWKTLTEEILTSIRKEWKDEDRKHELEKHKKLAVETGKLGRPEEHGKEALVRGSKHTDADTRENDHEGAPKRRKPHTGKLGSSSLEQVARKRPREKHIEEPEIMEPHEKRLKPDNST